MSDIAIFPVVRCVAESVLSLPLVPQMTEHDARDVVDAVQKVIDAYKKWRDSKLKYATSIIYPLSSIPDRFRWLILANPLTPIVEGFRFAFLGAGALDGWQLLYSFCFMLAILLIGILMFNQVERTFMDTVYGKGEGGRGVLRP